MHCGGCFIIRFINALSADLFWKQCIKTGHGDSPKNHFKTVSPPVIDVICLMIWCHERILGLDPFSTTAYESCEALVPFQSRVGLWIAIIDI